MIDDVDDGNLPSPEFIEIGGGRGQGPFDAKLNERAGGRFAFGIGGGGGPFWKKIKKLSY